MKTTSQQSRALELHLTNGITYPELPDVCFSPSWFADQDFDDQFWTTGLGSGEKWHLDGDKSLPGPS
jgi:hypothetical protein